MKEGDHKKMLRDDKNVLTPETSLFEYLEMTGYTQKMEFHFSEKHNYETNYDNCEVCADLMLKDVDPMGGDTCADYAN